ncbi:hypothetical protein Tco_0757983 [Tanacetum coccineum]
MSSDNASSAVTYTSVSSDSNSTKQSWGFTRVMFFYRRVRMDPVRGGSPVRADQHMTPAMNPDPMELVSMCTSVCSGTRVPPTPKQTLTHPPQYTDRYGIPSTHQMMTFRWRISLKLMMLYRLLSHLDTLLTRIRWRWILMRILLIIQMSPRIVVREDDEEDPVGDPILMSMSPKVSMMMILQMMRMRSPLRSRRGRSCSYAPADSFCRYLFVYLFPPLEVTEAFKTDGVFHLHLVLLRTRVHFFSVHVSVMAQKTIRLEAKYVSSHWRQRIDVA